MGKYDCPKCGERTDGVIHFCPDRLEDQRETGDDWAYSTARVTQYMLDTDLATGIRRFILSKNPDASKESIENTPLRFYKALEEMTSGYNSSPEDILGKVFECDCDDIVILKDIAFTSICEHHLLPIVGSADIGYLPGKVVGLSKLARLVDCFSKRFQMQERMTSQIAKAIEQHLQAKGVAVVTRAVHACLSCRGVAKSGATMVCSTMLGAFREESAARAEFLNLCKD